MNFDGKVAVVTGAATGIGEATACLLALHPTQSKAANFSGSSDLKLTSCSVMSSRSSPLSLRTTIRPSDSSITVGGVIQFCGL